LMFAPTTPKRSGKQNPEGLKIRLNRTKPAGLEFVVNQRKIRSRTTRRPPSRRGYWHRFLARC